jgi:peptide/nickel transport system substrate-binding protein
MRNSGAAARSVATLALGATCLLVPGLGHAQNATGSQGEPDSGGRLTVALPREPDNLNPLILQTFEAAEVLNVMHRSLIRMNAKMEFIPGVAESWSWSDDRLVLDLNLRHGMRWSDGAPFSAFDVVSSYELYDAEESPFPQKSLFNVLEAVQAPDSLHVRLKYAAELPDHIDRAVLDLLPRHATEGLDLAKVVSWKIDRAPITLGPYRLREWSAGRRIVVERNPYFYGKPARIGEIEFTFVPDASNRLLQLETGEVDMLTSIPHAQVDRLRDDPEVRLYPTPGRRIVYVMYNVRHPMFADARVRKAMSYAMDRRAMVDGLLYGYGHPGASIFPPVLWAHDDDVRPDSLDLDRAAALLDEAGWTDHDGDGTRDRDGVEFEFVLNTRAGDPTRENLAVLIHDDLAKLGVRARIAPLEVGAERRAAGDGEFDAMVNQFVAPLILVVEPFFASEGGANFGGYANVEVDSLIERLSGATDRASAWPLLRRIQQVLHEEQPWTVLYYPDTVVGIRTRVHDATPNFVTSLYGVESWWVEPDGHGDGR